MPQLFTDDRAATQLAHAARLRQPTFISPQIEGSHRLARREVARFIEEAIRRQIDFAMHLAQRAAREVSATVEDAEVFADFDEAAEQVNAAARFGERFERGRLRANR